MDDLRRLLAAATEVVVAMVVLVVAIAACGSDGADSGDQSAVAVEPGATVEVDPGATLTLRLDSNPSTGYMWAIREVSDPAVVHLVADEYVAPDTDDVGAAGAQLLTFETLAPGTADVQLWYIRSFEDPPVPADEASFIVQVTG